MLDEKEKKYPVREGTIKREMELSKIESLGELFDLIEEMRNHGCKNIKQPEGWNKDVNERRTNNRP